MPVLLTGPFWFINWLCLLCCQGHSGWLIDCACFVVRVILVVRTSGTCITSVSSTAEHSGAGVRKNPRTRWVLLTSIADPQTALRNCKLRFGAAYRLADEQCCGSGNFCQGRSKCTVLRVHLNLRVHSFMLFTLVCFKAIQQRILGTVFFSFGKNILIFLLMLNHLVPYQYCYCLFSVMNPDPFGYGTFSRIWNYLLRTRKECKSR